MHMNSLFNFYLLEKRYIVLCSYTEGVHNVGHAAIAVSLQSDVYITVHSPMHCHCMNLLAPEAVEEIRWATTYCLMALLIHSSA